jgi:hypothetical protein
VVAERRRLVVVRKARLPVEGLPGLSVRAEERGLVLALELVLVRALEVP